MTISDMGYTKEVMAIIKESYQRGKLDATYENGIRIEKNQFENGYRMGRADAIEECIQSIKDNWHFWNIGVIAEVIKKLEQLKEQK